MEEQGISFDKCLKTAQEMGYAEANPTADIDGIDVRNKIIISTSLAAKALVREEDVMTFGIRTVQKCDLDYFASINKSIRLFADGVIEHGSCCCRVEPALFSTDAPEASIKLNFNICTLKGKTQIIKAFCPLKLTETLPLTTPCFPEDTTSALQMTRKQSSCPPLRGL